MTRPIAFVSSTKSKSPSTKVISRPSSSVLTTGTFSSSANSGKNRETGIYLTGLEGELEGFTRDVLIASAACGAGDAIAQFGEFTSKNKEEDKIFGTFDDFDIDTRRSVAYTLFGGLYTGGFQHFVFEALSDTTANPYIRLAINQGLIIPIFYYSLLVWFVPKVRATSAAEREELRSKIDVLATIPKNWLFWVPLQFIQFEYISDAYQVAYCSICGLAWNTILSLLTAGSENEDATEDIPVMEKQK